MIKVKNINGSAFYSKPPKGYDSWLDYWEQQTGLIAKECHKLGCRITGRDNLVGAHVIKADSVDRHYYIVPLCKGCNNRTDEFYVFGPLVPCPSNNE